MATIKFIVQGKSDNASISLRLSIDKTKSFKRTTQDIALTQKTGVQLQITQN